MSKSIQNITVQDIKGNDVKLSSFDGKVLLVVNVASKCGLTPQYEGLENLYRTYQAQGLEVLGFPANEFAGQEPGTNSEIQEFCRSTFGVEFPMFAKMVVKGEGQHPLYKALIEAQPKAAEVPGSGFKAKLDGMGLLTGSPSDITWNFEKFLVDKHGVVVGRFAPDMTPEDSLIVNAIQAELQKS